MKNLIPLTPFYFLRHGETDWNKKGIYMGQKDIPLNELGKMQAQGVHQHIKSEPITHIVSSPLIRALETAQIINQALKLPITILDELKERSLGGREGTQYNSCFFEESLESNDEKHSELREGFQIRVIQGIRKALQIDQNILIVSHGGVYACLVRIMGWPVIDLNNCELVFHHPSNHESHPWSVCSLTGGSDFYE